MSRAGNVFTLFAWVWMVVGPVVVYSILGLIDIVERPLSVRLAGFTVILVVGFGPFVVVLLMMSFHGRRLASLRPFRWLLATTQPGASLDPDGIELCSPAAGCRRFTWDQIARMEPTIEWRRGSFVEGSPALDLTGPDGRVLFRVPPSIYERLEPAGSKRWWSRPLTLAEYVVVMRPDQFALLDTHPGWPHYWFRPVQASTDRGQATGAI